MNSVVVNERTTDSTTPESARNRSWTPFVLAVIAIATVCTYSGVLFNHFLGDDFVHLTWLTQAMQQPELIWRNFHSSWLDGTTTKFYRPLISIFMVTDYLVWGVNGLGFRLTNIAFHLASSGFIFAITSHLCRSLYSQNEQQKGALLWPTLAAAIFALYPLHPEAVSWITGRVDSIVTAFCLGSIWFYMRWRENYSFAGLKPDRSLLWLGASILMFVLGLLSKEMAITVPAVLVCYEFLLKAPFKISGVLHTSPFWGLLGGYFVLRRVALGTFVGGYDDSLFFISDLKNFVYTWVHALRMMLVPINKSIFGAHHILTKFWELYVIGSAIALAAFGVINKRDRQPLLFLFAWIALSLIPVYKIFAIGDDLQGSRLAYLATAPLSVLLAYGLTALYRFTTTRNMSRLSTATIVLAAGFIALNAALLWCNNLPWRAAGLQSNAIRASLAKLYSQIPGDPQVLFLNLPDQLQGAYVCRNALWGMTHAPQLQRDIANCLMVNHFEPILPFGFLKQSMSADRQSIKVFRWDPNHETFETVSIPAPMDDKVGTAFGAVFMRVNNETTESSIENDGIKIWATKPKTRPEVFFHLTNIHPWFADFVRVNLDVHEKGSGSIAMLLYADKQGDFSLQKRTHAMLNGNGQTDLLFPLRSLPEWSLQSGKSKLKLILPPNSKATIKSVTLVRPERVMPQMTFANAGYLGTKGFLNFGTPPYGTGLTEKIELQKVLVDASKVPGAAKTEIEVTRPNLLFEEQNTDSPSTRAAFYREGGINHEYALKLSDFSSVGMYELRAWAKDAQGKRLGVASDHIVISVNP